VVGTALTVAALGYGLSYALACLVLPRFRRIIGEPLLTASVVGYSVGAVLLVSLLCFVTWKIINGEALVAAIPLALIALLWWRFAVIARRRGPTEPLGVYDQTSQRELAPESVEAHFVSGSIRSPQP
jgi:amino acid transporter